MGSSSLDGDRRLHSVCFEKTVTSRGTCDESRPAGWIDLIVLAIDTSTDTSSLALTRDDRDLATIAVAHVRQHSVVLFDQVNLLLRLAQIDIRDVDLFTAITGPGSFTGLRIGLAAISGMARTLAKPLAGVTAFDASACSLGIGSRVAVLVDGGRSDVFAGLREVDAEGNPTPVGADFAGSVDVAVEELARRVMPSEGGLIVIGNAVIRHQEKILALAMERRIEASVRREVVDGFGGWLLLDASLSLAPPAARIAARQFGRRETSAFHPYYLKPSEAELKWKSGAGESRE